MFGFSRRRLTVADVDDISLVDAPDRGQQVLRAMDGEPIGADFCPVPEVARSSQALNESGSDAGCPW